MIKFVILGEALLGRPIPREPPSFVLPVGRSRHRGTLRSHGDGVDLGRVNPRDAQHADPKRNVEEEEEDNGALGCFSVAIGWASISEEDRDRPEGQPLASPWPAVETGISPRRPHLSTRGIDAQEKMKYVTKLTAVRRRASSFDKPTAVMSKVGR